MRSIVEVHDWVKKQLQRELLRDVNIVPLTGNQVKFSLPLNYLEKDYQLPNYLLHLWKTKKCVGYPKPMSLGVEHFEIIDPKTKNVCSVFITFNFASLSTEVIIGFIFS